MQRKYNILTRIKVLTIFLTLFLDVNPRLIIREPQKSFLSKRKKEKEKLNSGYQSTYIALVSFIVFLLIYYVWTINANATQWYEIRSLENVSKQLKDDLNRLESTISELDSANTIISDDMSKSMEQAYNPNYLVIKDDTQYVYNY